MQQTPGRLPKRLPRLVWIVPVVALAATAFWLAARGPRSAADGQQQARLDAARKQAAQVAAVRDALAELLAKVRAEPDPMAYVQARAGKEDTTTLSELVNAYAAWASRGDALEARRAIVKQLLGSSNNRIGMEALLKAVALDGTPRQQDPMWRELVDAVGRQWDPVTIAWGRDVVHTEANAKTKDLLMESLASAAPQKIGAQQQNLLVTDLIDLYPSAAPDQKAVFDKALTAMAGPDVVEILKGRGINQGSPPLASIQKINQELETSRAQYKKVLEQIEKDEREAQETNAREAAKSKR
jgi:hypothetical protein